MNDTQPATRIYACGGLGMNLGTSQEADKLNPAFLDTSMSNRRDNIDPERCVIIDGVDGSGGHRRHNYSVIAKEIDPFLNHFEPGVFNIILTSAGGGTGGVASSLILSRLLKAGHATVVIVVGDDTTDKRVENTINTLKSLEAISADAGIPVVMCYHQNGDVTRGQVDQDVRYTLAALGELASQHNTELDTQDVTNWLQYSNVTSAPHQLAALSIYESRQDAAQAIEPISIASLYANPDQERGFGSPHYNTVGFPESGNLLGGDQLHFVINHANVEPIFSRLNDRKHELNRTYGGYQQRKTIVDSDDELTPDGIVL